MDKSRLTFLGVIITIGIIFGDIGTSVLYVMKSFIHNTDSMMNESLVLGFVSLIFWVMTLQTTTKYVMIALKADNHGEGGVFSLFALIKNRTRRSVALLAMIGGATLLADGIITPAITVTSAVEGLHDIIPTINTNDVIILVILIFIFIFSFQRFGTKKIGSLFGPIMSIWFLSLLFWGIKSIITRPEILKAINPKYKLDSVYDLKLTDSLGNTIDSVGSKRTVTLTNTKGKSVVYYVYRDENNKLKLDKLQTYNDGNGSIVKFDAKHFSKYALVEEQTDGKQPEGPREPQPTKPEGDKNTDSNWNPFAQGQKAKEGSTEVKSEGGEVTTKSVSNRKEGKALPNTGLQTTSYGFLAAIVGLFGAVALRRKNR